MSEHLSPIYYMRDDHTFKRLSADVDTAIVEIEAEFNAGYTYGMLCSKRPGFKNVHAHGNENRFKFFAECKQALQSALTAAPTSPAQPAVPEDVRRALTSAKRALENWCALHPDQKDALDTIAFEAIDSALSARQVQPAQAEVVAWMYDKGGKSGFLTTRESVAYQPDHYNIYALCIAEQGQQPIADMSDAAEESSGRQVQPAQAEAVDPADGWMQDRGLLYRLTYDRRPQNRDEIRVTMANGSRSDEACSRRAGELLDRIRATAPTAVPQDVRSLTADQIHGMDLHQCIAAFSAMSTEKGGVW